MRTMTITLFSALALITSTACSSRSTTETVGTPTAEVDTDAAQKADLHKKAIASAATEFEDIMRPSEDKLRWSDTLNGDAEDQAVCDLDSRYSSLLTFQNAHSGDADVKLSEISGSGAIEAELQTRGTAYVTAALKAVKQDRFPQCIKTNDENSEAGAIREITSQIESLGLRPNDIGGTTPTDLRLLYTKAVRKGVPALLTDYRLTKGANDDKRDQAIRQLCELVQEKHFAANEIGIPAGDYAKFANAKNIGEGGYCLQGECPVDEQ